MPPSRTCSAVTSKSASQPAQNKLLEAGDRVVVTVQKQSPQGDGIAFCGDKEIYIPLGLCGEEVEVELGQPFARGSRAMWWLPVNAPPIQRAITS